MAICGGTGIATENKKVTFFNFFPFGGDVWRYVAVPVSPRKTKKWLFLTFFLLVAMCGDMWRYRYRHGKQKSDFFLTFFLLVAMCGDMWRYRYRHGKQKK